MRFLFNWRLTACIILRCRVNFIVDPIYKYADTSEAIGGTYTAADCPRRYTNQFIIDNQGATLITVANAFSLARNSADCTEIVHWRCPEWPEFSNRVRQSELVRVITLRNFKLVTTSYKTHSNKEIQLSHIHESKSIFTFDAPQPAVTAWAPSSKNFEFNAIGATNLLNSMIVFVSTNPISFLTVPFSPKKFLRGEWHGSRCTIGRRCHWICGHQLLHDTTLLASSRKYIDQLSERNDSWGWSRCKGVYADPLGSPVKKLEMEIARLLLLCHQKCDFHK